MRVKISKSKNSESYSLIRDIVVDGKRTTEVVESLGNRVEISKAHPGIDPYEWAKEQARIRRQDELNSIFKFIKEYDANRLIDMNKKVKFNIGYIFLEKIYYQLGLDSLCKKIEANHKFEYSLSSILKMLLYTRILYPSSKASSYESAQNFLSLVDFPLHQVYRALDILSEHSEQFESLVYEKSKALVKRNTKILFYDCTNFYFEIEEAKGIRQYGFSKEHRPNPIVQMGLFLDGSGIPLAFSIWPGNTNEQITLKPLEKRIIEDFNLSKFVVCTDAGLSSKTNRNFNNMGSRFYVTTKSLKKSKGHIKEWALDPSGWKTSLDKVEYDLREIDKSSKNKSIYYKERWINEDGIKEKIVVSYSPIYENYHRSLREAQIERAVKKMDNPSKLNQVNQQDSRRFIKSEHMTSDGDLCDVVVNSLDEEKIDQEAKYDGFYAVVTNLEAEPYEIAEIIYRRWQIEDCFRIMKSEFEARPVYLQKDNRIEAHFLTCFLSLLIFRILEKQLGNEFTSHEILEKLKEMEIVELDSSSYIPAYIRTELTDKLHDTIGFRTDTEIIPKKILKKNLKTLNE